MNARLRALVDGFAGKTLVVVGDLITDEYLYGKPARISREAPVLILRFTEREVSLGGAANAAHNVHDLGARVVPVGGLGNDGPGDRPPPPPPRGGGLPPHSPPHPPPPQRPRTAQK